MSLYSDCSLFVAVIVDNLARTQAAANATKPKPKSVKVHNQLLPMMISCSSTACAELVIIYTLYMDTIMYRS